MRKTTTGGDRPSATLALKFGRVLEANATGWGVAALPLVLIVLLGAAALGLSGRLF